MKKHIYLIVTMIVVGRLFAADLKNSLLYTDVVEIGEKYLFYCNEIDDLTKYYGKGARLPDLVEAEAICKVLDEINLAGVYERSDFPMIYQDFFIASDASSEPLAFCPTSANEKTKKLGSEAKCCVRFVIDKKHNSDWYKILCLSTDMLWSKCTLQNAYNLGSSALICYCVYKYVVNPAGAPPGTVRNIKERVVQVFYFARNKISDLVKQRALPAACEACL